MEDIPREKFNTINDFINNYIIKNDITEYQFVCSQPYIVSGVKGVCLDVSDNNMMQYFIYIENGTLNKVQSKIVDYFKNKKELK